MNEWWRKKKSVLRSFTPPIHSSSPLIPDVQSLKASLFNNMQSQWMVGWIEEEDEMGGGERQRESYFTINPKKRKGMVVVVGEISGRSNETLGFFWGFKRRRLLQAPLKSSFHLLAPQWEKQRGRSHILIEHPPCVSLSSLLSLASFSSSFIHIPVRMRHTFPMILSLRAPTHARQTSLSFCCSLTVT